MNQYKSNIGKTLKKFKAWTLEEYMQEFGYKFSSWPWTINFHNKNYFQIFDSNKKIVVDSLEADLPDDVTGGFLRQSDISNAHLISAAPEMLIALENAYLFLGDNEEDINGLLMTEIFAAVSKAKGIK